MTNREKYQLLCEQEDMPLHAQAWWWEQSTVGKSWDAIILENAEGQIEAAMPYQLTQKHGFRVALMPMHTQYNYVYIGTESSPDIYERLVQALDNRCKELHIGWFQTQGFYPLPLLEAFRAHGYTINERITYRINTIPSIEDLATLFSENKRRQLRKAKNLQLVDLSAEEFYTFHQDCLKAQGKTIDYTERWAKAVLPEAVKRQHGRLIAAQNMKEELMAAMFIAWDSQYAYYLLPTYHPKTKKEGAVAWLTAEALSIAHAKGLRFDFEGSMTPSIAVSYKQFGGFPAVYHSITKFYNPIYRIAAWLLKHE